MKATHTLRINVLLASLGALGGAIAALPITALGKILTGAPPATASNYLWNIGVLAAVAAIGSPFLTWSALRRVPLWRAIAEPGAGAVAGGAIALGLGAPVAFLVLMPVGIGVAAWRLHYAYREPALVGPETLLSADTPTTSLREKY